MVAAVETQRSVAEGGIHEGAMMRLFRIGMDVRPEEAAGQAQALRLDGALPLEGKDRLRQRAPQAGALAGLQRADGVRERDGPRR
jgi:hypothetical protein